MIDTAQSFKLIADYVPVHIVITDADGTVVYANAEASRITGYSQEEMEGANPRLWGRQMTADFYRNFWKTIKTDKQPFQGQIINRRKNGDLYTAELKAAPILDVAGQVTGFVSIERDITEELRLQSVLLEEEERLSRAEEIVKIGNFVYEKKNGKFTWSKGMFRVLEFDRIHGQPAMQDYLNGIHPYDRAEYIRLWDKASVDGIPYTYEFRWVHAGETARWLRIMVFPIRDSSRQVVKLFGTVLDFTDDRLLRDQASSQLKELERLNQILVSREIRMADLKKEIQDLKFKQSETTVKP